MRRTLFLLGVLGLLSTPLGCNVDSEGLCTDLCNELVDECQFEAFPADQPGSCYDGCMYDKAERGAAVAPLTECVLDAECDAFVILQCARAYGGSDHAVDEEGDDDE